MFETLVEEKEKELIKNNLKDLRNNISNSDYQYKIDKYCEKFNFKKEEVIEQIKENDIVASFFMKDPLRQNFIEKMVAELLNTSILSQTGKNSVRFNSKGELGHLKTPNTSKAADFYINNTYITQKYTRGFGGAQDNQYNDVVDFLLKGSQQYRVGAILDGSYWEEKRKELENFFQDNENVSIYSMDDFLLRED